MTRGYMCFHYSNDTKRVDMLNSKHAPEISMERTRVVHWVPDEGGFINGMGSYPCPAICICETMFNLLVASLYHFPLDWPTIRIADDMSNPPAAWPWLYQPAFGPQQSNSNCSGLQIILRIHQFIALIHGEIPVFWWLKYVKIPFCWWLNRIFRCLWMVFFTMSLDG